MILENRKDMHSLFSVRFTIIGGYRIHRVESNILYVSREERIVLSPFRAVAQSDKPAQLVPGILYPLSQ